MEWRRDASEVRTVWPYPVKENVIKLQINARLMDGSIPLCELPLESNWLPRQGSNLADKRATLEIYSLDKPWTEVVLECSVSIDDPDSMKEVVLPPGHSSPLSFALLLRCDNTRWRKAVISSFDDGKADLTFSIARSDVAGDVGIQPLVILAASTVPTTGVWAHWKAAKVATGFPVYFRADEPLQGPGRGIEVKWAKFNDPIAAALYRLEIISDEKAILYLNDGYPALGPVLNNRSKVRNERTIVRDAMFSFIATDVWFQLGDVAAHSVPEGGSEEEEEWPALYERVLKYLERHLGLDREDIVSRFTDGSEGMRRAELQEQLQSYLALAGKAESTVLAAPEKPLGGN